MFLYRPTIIMLRLLNKNKVANKVSSVFYSILCKTTCTPG